MMMDLREIIKASVIQSGMTEAGFVEIYLVIQLRQTASGQSRYMSGQGLHILKSTMTTPWQMYL